MNQQYKTKRSNKIKLKGKKKGKDVFKYSTKMEKKLRNKRYF